MNEDLKRFLMLERERQEKNVELIASENYASKAILDLQGSILTNKYAEGYPEKRYYGGCEIVDLFEEKAISLARELFGAKYVNVQPHSGSSANMAVLRALLNPGDFVLGMNLDHGGHLTHGSKVNFSGKDYNFASYGVNEITEEIDYEELRLIVRYFKPKLIIAGSSAYSKKIDFEEFRRIADEVGAYLMVDMAHIAGLVVAGVHMNPVPFADVVTSTTHKTLRGPRGGIILTNNEEISKKVNKTVFPGIQGGPLMHVIAAKAQCFSEALEPDFKEYAINVLKNAKAMAEEFKRLGVKVVSGGTDNHLMLIDVNKSFGLTGKEAETILDGINVTVNKNMIPFDKLKPNLTSGLRLGSAAMTTRGLNEEDFRLITQSIVEVLRNKDNEKVLNSNKSKILELTKKHPLNY